MISNRMADALNEQIKNELFSSYLYLAMAAYFSGRNLYGFAHWMRMQAKEEDLHTMMFYDYVLDQGARVDLRTVDGPPMDYASAADVFEKTLAHERMVTSLIHTLVNIAREEKDVATEIFLQWFVTEQVEEESTADEILKQIELVRESGSGLLMIDRKLATRVFTPPPAGGA